jgi:hypothetical protein
MLGDEFAKLSLGAPYDQIDQSAEQIATFYLDPPPKKS